MLLKIVAFLYFVSFVVSDNKQPGEPCTNDDECTLDPGTFCDSTTRVCTCLPGNEGKPGPCFIGYNSLCTDESQCRSNPLQGMSCIDDRCACPSGLVFNKDSTDIYTDGRCELEIGFSCVPDSDKPCGYDSICSPDTNTCKCGQYSHVVDGYCSCVPSAYKISRDQCTCVKGSIENPEDPNNCLCPDDKYPNTERKRCLSCPWNAVLNKTSKATCICDPPLQFNLKLNTCEEI